ncbi:hypothetical protein [Sedimentitalea nanhaiensis]|uniref:Uncharacterized protein n=1 Tax=Sedimentitalea nanhaiensis TaxID=999627 RepID=A0A1I7EC54_9RHOB|nr:hypothetical protein [Sedimentitalea nanhaiensis]SFU21546.1 hypothetical protein SAMN05216236_1632 [Sedimentitalea nanhaiensis]
MSTLETLASKLAEDTMVAMEETGEDRLFVQIGDMLAASSQSLEEAYLTEVRVRLAERAARRFLDAKIAAAREAGAQRST